MRTHTHIHTLAHTHPYTKMKCFKIESIDGPPSSHRLEIILLIIIFVNVNSSRFYCGTEYIRNDRYIVLKYKYICLFPLFWSPSSPKTLPICFHVTDILLEAVLAQTLCIHCSKPKGKPSICLL